MTYYLPEDSSLRIGNILYSPTANNAVAGIKAGKTLRLSDTISSRQQQETSSKSVIYVDRPNLLPPQSQAPQGDLMILAAAFCKAFTAMSNSIITQTQDYTQLQQLDQTQTHAVLDSTTNAINKQEAAEKEAAEVAAYQEQVATVNTDFGWTMFAVGLVVIVATLASGFFDGGLSFGAVPEETSFEMTEFAAASADNVADINTEDLEIEDLSSDESSGSDTDETTDTSSNPVKTGENPSKTEELDRSIQQSKKSTDDLEKSSAANKKSQDTWYKKLGKFALKMGVAAGFNSPMLLKGIFGVIVANKLNDLAQDQLIVGSALSIVQRNNMYFQFLQQLLQREGSVLQEETSNASEVVDTFSTITSAWRGISYGLANAV